MASPRLALRAELGLSKFRCQVRLGCSREERATPQWVSFELRARFAEIPEACLSDQVDDTVCYAKLSSILERICAQREYQLLEKLGFDAFASLREELPRGTLLRLTVIKENPPIENLAGGSWFALSDPELS